MNKYRNYEHDYKVILDEPKAYIKHCQRCGTVDLLYSKTNDGLVYRIEKELLPSGTINICEV